MNQSLQQRTNLYLLKSLNLFFHCAHIFIIVFFLFGWIFEPTRTAHLLLCGIIFTSWCVFGMFYGFGYCVVTDLQWRIMKKLNHTPHTQFYVKYIVDKILRLDTNPKLMDGITVTSFFSITTISISLLINSHFNIF